MGHRKKSAPRRGSLGFMPRKRAEELVPRVKSWPQVNVQKPTLLAFLGYKVGMTHVFIVDNRQGSPTFGKEVFRPITVIETPPMYVLAVRGYAYDENRGLYAVSEAWAKPPLELELNRRISTLGSFDTEATLKSLESKISDLAEVRVLLASQPKLTGGLSKKAPDLIEVKVAAPNDSVKEAFSYATSILGKTVSVRDVFQPGMVVDVLAVTKGKGFQGEVKRFGVKVLPRWHKHRKGARGVGARSHGRGTWWEIPQPGQLGFHRRTEYNKRVLEITDNALAFTPAGGFLHYGVPASTVVVLEGSVPGVVKRPIVLRYPIRPPEWYLKMGVTKPTITFVSLQSKQGV
ncbi:MAG: archaeal ribosomal protein L3 [uncultured Acidilobus sp. OSP8]|nr:MAG: archaeal ribosomal protein L3 [uncultured Acidilobus sp. OSP8]